MKSPLGDLGANGFDRDIIHVTAKIGGEGGMLRPARHNLVLQLSNQAAKVEKAERAGKAVEG